MIGETVLHYKITEKLGQGGMGIVYKAEDIKLKRSVALKFLPPHITSSAEVLARFRLEAQAAAILNHPNICTVYAIEEESGRKFISMEYMEGITLREKISYELLNINDALLYAIQIGEALNEAHKNGIVHRDIKTENIMINSKNQIKVMDFGLAKLKDSTSEAQYESTYGTLAYMSPEQAVDKAVGFPADIWSYGVVCYEMFTGKLPFLQSYEAAIIYSILNEEPVPPSQIRPDIPTELESIILKCLRKKEDERYPGMDLIVRDLRRLKSDIETQAFRENYKKQQAKELKKAAEQKQATIVYMRIQNYSGLLERLGQENIVEILERYYEIINASAAKYGGTVNETATSNAVLYFGLPETIENAAQNAVGAVIEITREFDYLCKKYRIPGNFKLNIAVSSGTVIAGSISSGRKLEYTVIGDAVETAVKLLETAVDGQILAGALTYRSLKDMYSFKPYKAVSIKGKRDPITVYELESTDKKRAADAKQSERLIESEMVGRTKELDKLEFLLLKAINGEGSIANIIADAGIGKSRLIKELKKKDLLQRCVLLEGKAEFTDKNVGFHPVISIIKQWANINEEDNESQAFSKLEDTVLNLFKEEANEIIPFIAALMGYGLSGDYAQRLNEVSPDALSKLIQKSIRLLVMKGSELKPMVIIIEDIHWADLSSIELLLSLFRLAENNRLLFINTLRPNYAETGDKFISVIRERYTGIYSELRLSPLNTTDRQMLVRNLLRMKVLPGQIEKSISKNTEGNPFFMEEVIRSMISENLIEIKNGQFIISKDAEDIVIPGSVKDVLLSRIDKLNEPEKYILKAASVIGRYFLYDILEKVTGEIDNFDVRLQTLIKLELISENANVREREYLFVHALAQEAVYETLLTKDKQEMHLKTAVAIEKLYAAKIGDFYELLAHHYSLADDKEKAEEYLIKAGERTLKNAASNEALNYFEQALKFYLQKFGKDVDKEKIFMLEKNIGMSFYNKGYFIDSVEHFGNALRAIGIKTDRSKPGELLHLTFNLLAIVMNLYLPVRKPGSFPTDRENELFDILFKIANSYANYNAKKMFFELLNLIRVKTGYKLKAEDGFETYSFASSLFTYSGISFSLGKKFLAKADSIARLNGIEDIYNTGYDYIIYTCLSGNWKNFKGINEKLLEIKLRAGDLFKAVYNISWALYIVIGRGEYEYAEYLINKGDDISETYDFDYGKLYMLSFKADLCLSRRDLLKSVKYYDESCTLAEKLGLDSWILGLSGKRAKAYLLLNDLPSAKKSIDKSEKALNDANSLTPMLMGYFTCYKFLFLVRKFEYDFKKNNQDDYKINSFEKVIRESMNKALKVSKKVAEIKPEVYRYIGDFYWQKDKYKTAAKYFQKSINTAEQLGALPELGRSFLEYGRFLSDPGTGMTGKNPDNQYSEAEIIFNKLNLKWDTDELKRIRNYRSGYQDKNKTTAL